MNKKNYFWLLSLVLALAIFYGCSKARRPTNLDINSAPQNATYLVLQQGKTIATGTTPAKLSLRPGTYTIIVKKGGYKDFITETVLRKGFKEVLNPKLQPLPGRLKITSFPQNAKIYVDDVFWGRTPRTINNLAAGQHKIFITLSGYQSYSDTVVVEPGQIQEINATLIGGRGRLDLKLSQKADVYIDGKHIGEIRERNLELAAGEHKLVVYKPGFDIIKRTFVLTDGKELRLVLNLKPAKTKEVEFVLSPADSKLRIEGISFNSRKVTLPYGSYFVEAIRENYTPFSDYVKIGKNTQEIEIKLVPKPGNIYVNSTPSEAEVFLNDQMKGITPLILKSVDPGIYKALLKKRGYNSKNWSFELKPNGSVTFNIILTKHYKFILRKAFSYVSAAPSNFSAPVFTRLLGDKIYIADSGNSRILVLDISGSVKKVISNKEVLLQPVAFIVDEFKNLFVVDQRANRILKFDKEGSFLQSYGDKGSSAGFFNQPTDIAKYGKRYVYVVDSQNARVQIFNPNMKFLTAFGLRGRGLGQFLLPNSIAVHPTSGVFITDLERQAILRFDYLGIFRKEINTSYIPLYITLDPEGNLVVSGSDGKIRKYDVDLRLIEVLDVQDISLYKPGKIAISPEYSLIVPDSQNDKVYILERQWDEQYYR